MKTYFFLLLLPFCLIFISSGFSADVESTHSTLVTESTNGNEMVAGSESLSTSNTPPSQSPPSEPPSAQEENDDLKFSIADFVAVILLAIVSIYLWAFYESKRRTKNEVRMRAILENVDNAIVATNNLGNIVYLNSIAKETFSLTDAVKGVAFDEIFHFYLLDTEAEKESMVQIVIDTGMHARTEEVEILRLQDGERLFVSGTAAPLHYSKNKEKVDGVVVALLDLTSIHHKDKRLNELGFYMDKLPYEVVVLDQELNYCYVNRYAADLREATVDEMLGSNFYDFNRAMPQRQRDKILRTIEKYGTYSYDTFFTLPNGNSYPAQVRVTKIVSGGESLYYLTAKDISPEKKLEETIRGNDFLIQQIQHFAKLDFWCYNPKNRLIIWSRDELSRREMHEALTAPSDLDEEFSDHIMPIERALGRMLFSEEKAEMVGNLIDIVDQKRSFEMTFRVHPPQGQKTKYIHVYGWPEKNPDGDICIFGLEQDVTQFQEKEDELSLAQQVQMSFLPTNFQTDAYRSFFSVAAASRSALELGGDFYDLFMLDEDHLVLVVGDVSGKGVSAALLMAVSKTLFNHIAREEKDIAVAMEKLNDELLRNKDDMNFVTMLCGTLDLRTGDFYYANAGHLPPIFTPAGQHPDLLFDPLASDAPVPPAVGLFPGAKYETQHVKMDVGDGILIYTDGVTDLTDQNGRMFGTIELLQVVHTYSKGSVQEVVNRMIERFEEFSKKRDQFDDITLVNLRFLRKKTEFD